MSPVNLVGWVGQFPPDCLGVSGPLPGRSQAGMPDLLLLVRVPARGPSLGGGAIAVFDRLVLGPLPLAPRVPMGPCAPFPIQSNLNVPIGFQRGLVQYVVALGHKKYSNDRSCRLLLLTSLPTTILVFLPKASRAATASPPRLLLHYASKLVVPRLYHDNWFLSLAYLNYYWSYIWYTYVRPVCCSSSSC